MIKTRFIAGAALLIFSAACSQSSSPSTTSATGPTEIVMPLNFSTHMHGHLEVPARQTEAKGNLILKVSHDRQSIEYTLVATNIDNVVASHIHRGAPGVAGPAVVFLFGPAPAGGGRHNGVLAKGTITSANLISELQGAPLSALLDLIESGNAYANVHTNDGVGDLNTGPGDYFAGEIRGQIK